MHTSEDNVLQRQWSSYHAAKLVRFVKLALKLLLQMIMAILIWSPFDTKERNKCKIGWILLKQTICQFTCCVSLPVDVLAPAVLYDLWDSIALIVCAPYPYQSCATLKNVTGLTLLPGQPESYKACCRHCASMWGETGWASGIHIWLRLGVLCFHGTVYSCSARIHFPRHTASLSSVLHSHLPFQATTLPMPQQQCTSSSIIRALPPVAVATLAFVGLFLIRARPMDR